MTPAVSTSSRARSPRPWASAPLSTTFGGKLIQHFNYRISFLALGAIALLAFLLVATAIPETLADRSRKARQSGSGPSSTTLPQELPA